MNAIVSADHVNKNRDNKNFVIVDCRFYLEDKAKGYEEYLVSHIPNAVYLNLEKDLSGPVHLHGGRHPLPSLTEFARKLGEAGIDHRTEVVIYDDGSGAMAARLWWMLKYTGHERVFILNRGYKGWIEKGLPVNDSLPVPKRKEYIVDLQTDWIVEMEEVKSKLEKDDVTILDSRSRDRYLGLTEPIDPVAGHIPGAVNVNWTELFQEDGSWISKEAAVKHFNELNRNHEIIVHCGSGVTACPNFIGLMEAGFQHIKLYVGSWSDWCSYSENPVATKDDSNK